MLIGSFEFPPTRAARPNQNKYVGSSDKVSKVPMIVGGFGFLPSRGAQPTQNKSVGSSDNISEVPINTFSANNRNPYYGKTNQSKSKHF